jgi:exonuclease SbcD
MDRLRRRFPHTLVLGFEPTGGTPAGVPAAPPRGRSDHAIALDFVEQVRGTPATEAESVLLLAACDACCEDPDVDVLVSRTVDQ